MGGLIYFGNQKATLKSTWQGQLLHKLFTIYAQ